MRYWLSNISLKVTNCIGNLINIIDKCCEKNVILLLSKIFL